MLRRISLIHAALEDGALVASLDIARAADPKNRFACLKGQETRRHIRAFRDWALDQTARMHDFFGDRRFFHAVELAK